MRRSSPVVVCAIASAVVLVSCDLFTGPGQGFEPSFILSDAGAVVESMPGFLTPGALGTEPVAYISLPPGTVPGGVSATILNRSAMSTASGSVVDGGLDPVRIAASPGDTLEIVVWSEEGEQLVALADHVPPKRRPVVVRTSPPRGKRDVVLNSVLLVVFSEPIDPGTAQPGAIRLLRGGVAVTGAIELAADGLSARFRPDALLAAEATYTLQVTTAITDLEGDPLETGVAVEFRTGLSMAQPASVVIAPNPLRSIPYGDDSPWGRRLPLRASVLDGEGNAIAYGGPIEWRTSDTTIVTVGLGSLSAQSGEQVEFVRPGWGPGTATITATAGGVSGATSVILEHVPFDAVTMGYNGFECLLADDGAPYCVGGNLHGELGLGFASVFHSEMPARLSGDVSFDEISAGYEYACGIAVGGGAYCWGSNSYGQLGDGTRAPFRTTPVEVAAGAVAFRQVGAGLTHTCALSTGGGAYCWGAYLWPGARMLGAVPAPVAGNRIFTTLAVGGSHACALDAAGAAYCWGANDGRLGDGSVENSSVPVAVAGGHSFAAIAASGGHTCALTAAGKAYCWGLGSGGRSESGVAPVPVAVDLPPEVALVEISAGWMLTCGLTAEGAAYCWGWTWPCDACDEAVIRPARVDEHVYRSLAVGEADDACGVTIGGDVRCWRARELLP